MYHLEQFYSLVCRELLKKGLGLWRGDDGPSVSLDSSVDKTSGASSSTGSADAGASAGQGDGKEPSPTTGGVVEGSGLTAGGASSEAAKSAMSGGGSGGGLGESVHGVSRQDPEASSYLEVGPEGLFPAPLDVRKKSFCVVVETRFR